MDTSVSFIISSLITLIIMAITYFVRKKVNTNETKIYSYLLITSIIGSIISIPLYYSIKDYPTFDMYTFFLPRLYLLYITVFVFTMASYLKTITSRTNKNFLADYRTFYVINLFGNLLLLLVLPISYHNSNNIIYVNGIAVYYTYIVCAIEFLYMLGLIFDDIKNISFKKVIPFILLMIIGIGAAVSQFYSPNIKIVSFAIALIVQIMFFTIENPDARLLEQVKQSKEEVEKANKTKSDFLSIISHEVRNPLNTIVNFSDELRKDKLTNPQHEEVEDIYQSSLDILETIDSIIDINKLDNNTLEIQESNYQIEKVYKDLVLFAKEKLKNNKNISFNSSISIDLPKYLYGDSFRIKQITLNLLANAIKYTKEGYINFKIECDNKIKTSNIIITVEDSGIGIKKRNITRLFNDINNKDDIEKTGLGLSLSKKLIGLMNGQIHVDSTYKKGTKFQVTIEQKIVNANEIHRDKIKKITDNQIKSDLSKYKVLVVDDNKLNLKVAKRLLETYSLKVDSVISGEECIDKVNNDKYDLILLDDMMPKLSGKETLEKLKENSSFSIPVVALTANAIYGEKEEYLKLGFDDYLAKPIEKDELNRVIKKFLDK